MSNQEEEILMFLVIVTFNVQVIIGRNKGDSYEKRTIKMHIPKDVTQRLGFVLLHGFIYSIHFIPRQNSILVCSLITAETSYSPFLFLNRKLKMRYIVSILLLVSIVLGRVPSEERTFVSEVVDKFISDIKPNFIDPELADLFENCYPNTLDTTVYSFTPSESGDEDTFLITGDITAMWLRDSTNQVLLQ